MRFYKAIGGYSTRLYTDSDKYYLCYNVAVRDGIAIAKYISIFKGTGRGCKEYNELFIWEIRCTNNIHELTNYPIGDKKLSNSQYIIEDDMIFELTDEEVYNHILLESI